jgi:hypothetical protein
LLLLLVMAWQFGPAVVDELVYFAPVVGPNASSPDPAPEQGHDADIFWVEFVVVSIFLFAFDLPRRDDGVRFPDAEIAAVRDRDPPKANRRLQCMLCARSSRERHGCFLGGHLLYPSLGPFVKIIAASFMRRDSTFRW